jgi:hypothetical protein
MDKTILILKTGVVLESKINMHLKYLMHIKWKIKKVKKIYIITISTYNYSTIQYKLNVLK